MALLIYSIVNPAINEVVYIGATDNFDRRKEQHLCNSGNTGIKELVEKLKLCGEKPVFNIIEECEIRMVGERELFWIKYYSKNGKLLNDKTNRGRYPDKERKTRWSFHLFNLGDKKIFTEVDLPRFRSALSIWNKKNPDNKIEYNYSVTGNKVTVYRVK